MRKRYLYLTIGLALAAGACDPSRIIDELRPPSPGRPGPSPDGATPSPVTPPDGCQCSRRPGPLVSPFKCPTGVDQSSAAVIGPDGGTLTLTGQQGRTSGVDTRLEVAPGTVAAATKFTITELSTPPPAGFVDYSPVLRFDPVDAALARAVRLRIPWSNMDGSIDRALSIYYSETGLPPWHRLPTEGNAGFTDVTVDRLGYFFAGYPDTDQPAHCK